MIQLQDICSLTDFQRNAKEHLERLKATGRPQVLTVNGKAEVVVQDAESYQRLLDLVDRAEAIEGIRKGLESMERGEGRPADEVFEEIRRKYNIPRTE
ncbi:MAG: type II toxin-antitoxin system Phd/YefM family antitoxin [Phycisphaerae bacterium]